MLSDTLPPPSVLTPPTVVKPGIMIIPGPSPLPPPQQAPMNDTLDMIPPRPFRNPTNKFVTGKNSP